MGGSEEIEHFPDTLHSRGESARIRTYSLVASGVGTIARGNLAAGIDLGEVDRDSTQRWQRP